MRRFQYFLFVLFLMMLIVTTAGCKMVKVENVRVEDLDYTIVTDRDLPEELKSMIQKMKGEEFDFTYEFEGYLYIVKGYGKQDTGGYSITVNDLYLGKNAIYVEMDLYGPETIDEKAEGASYPYIVLKLEGRSEPVIFQ